ncbi:MAG: hypothetical protein JST64_03835 [Actinobacteria bacterium]|nr:hypothetical protein [Actinomycetota bacterium]
MSLLPIAAVAAVVAVVPPLRQRVLPIASAGGGAALGAGVAVVGVGVAVVGVGVTIAEGVADVARAAWNGPAATED